MSEASDIRLLPAAHPRVESGPTQFGNDWPGTFVRGDSAGYYAMALGQLLAGEAGAALGPFEAMTLRSLQALLAGAVVGPAAAMVAPAAVPADGLPEAGEYFRHVDGGLYRKKGKARYSEDDQALVVYEHLWPFERGNWARPESQWATRFSPIPLAQVREAMKGDRSEAQAAVNEAKAERRRASAG